MMDKLTPSQRIRVVALTQAVRHVDTHNAGYQGASTVLAFAEYFEEYIRTGETDLDKIKPSPVEEDEDE